MQCFGIPFKPLGPKMTKTGSCSNTTRGGDRGLHGTRSGVPQEVLSVLVRHGTVTRWYLIAKRVFQHQITIY